MLHFMDGVFGENVLDGFCYSVQYAMDFHSFQVLIACWQANGCKSRFENKH